MAKPGCGHRSPPSSSASGSSSRSRSYSGSISCSCLISRSRSKSCSISRSPSYFRSFSLSSSPSRSVNSKSRSTPSQKRKSWEVVMGDSNSNKFLRDFCIPDYIIESGSEVKSSSHLPACPVIVFINSKSGGQLGSKLLVMCRMLLNKNQVVDLGEQASYKVLHQLYVIVKKTKAKRRYFGC